MKMIETNEEPNFEELTTMKLPDEGLIFNAQKVGRTDFTGLRRITDYGEGFRMSTIPELVPLVYTSLENKKKYDTAKNVVKIFKNNWITGNTGILYVPKGMFVQDNPELKDGRIFMNQEVLESKLGSHEERGVKFSDDGSVRFTLYNFKRNIQTPLELSMNTGIIALVGGEENAEKFAKASEHYRKKPCFSIFKDIDSPRIRVADMGSYSVFSNALDIDANSTEGFSSRCSFGVQKIKQKKKE